VGIERAMSPIGLGEATILVYPDQERARRAVDALVEAGVPCAAVTVIAAAPGTDGPDATGSWELPADIRIGQDRRDLLEGTGIGALAGLAWGGEIAVVTGAGGLLALGPVAFGMLYLGFLGGVVALGARHQVAKSAAYRADLHRGHVLVVVRAPLAFVEATVRACPEEPMALEQFPHRLG
jgi:hypothetical protein